MSTSTLPTREPHYMFAAAPVSMAASLRKRKPAREIGGESWRKSLHAPALPYGYFAFFRYARKTKRAWLGRLRSIPQHQLSCRMNQPIISEGTIAGVTPNYD